MGLITGNYFVWFDEEEVKKGWPKRALLHEKDKNNSVESDHEVGWMTKILRKMSILNE